MRRRGVPVIYVNDNFGRWRSDLRALGTDGDAGAANLPSQHPPRYARHQHEEDGRECDAVVNTRTPVR